MLATLVTFNRHITDLLAKSARSFYALKTTRADGLDGDALWDYYYYY